MGKIDKYKRSWHAIYDIQYHIIWCTKYRYPILTGDIGKHARDLLRQIAMAREVTIIRGAVTPDHIHMLVAGDPSLAPSITSSPVRYR
ncbi:MAG TPA: IS200/IS605 family transposase [Sedimentisphaerales bacterium]|nr:IS200/IS605 family transposase [Sedimentisphaerales bacterium]